MDEYGDVFRDFFAFVRPLKGPRGEAWDRETEDRENEDREKEDPIANPDATKFCEMLMSLCKDGTHDFFCWTKIVERDVAPRAFRSLPLDASTKRPYVEFELQRDCDVVRGLSCSHDHRVHIGDQDYGPWTDGDAIPIISTAFHLVTVRAFVGPEDERVGLSYVCASFDNQHRRELARGKWTTKTACYCSGMARPRGPYWLV